MKDLNGSHECGNHEQFFVNKNTHGRKKIVNPSCLFCIILTQSLIACSPAHTIISSPSSTQRSRRTTQCSCCSCRQVFGSIPPWCHKVWRRLELFEGRKDALVMLLLLLRCGLRFSCCFVGFPRGRSVHPSVRSTFRL